MTNFSILKCHGSGNDFFLIDELAQLLFTEEQRPVLARLLSDRKGLFGSDGILFVQRSEKADVKMRMFNPDGSEPQTCGNGLRCVARFASEHLSRDSVSIETMKGVSTAFAAEEIAPGVKTYTVEVGPLSTRVQDLPLIVESATLLNCPINQLSADLRFTAVSAPNPHLVTLVDNIDKSELTRIGTLAGALPTILPERANVSFCRVLDSDRIAVATFERGTGLTLGCGSAMAASALSVCMLELSSFDKWIAIFTEGGFVRAQVIKTKQSEYRALITGNATFVFSAKTSVDFNRQVLPSSFDGYAFGDEIMAYRTIQQAGEDVMLRLERSSRAPGTT